LLKKKRNLKKKSLNSYDIGKVLNALASKVRNTYEAVGISSKKITLLTSTIESSRFTVKAF